MSVPRWVAAADEIDAFDVALSLHRASGGPTDQVRAELTQARFLLLTGRPEEALVLLHRQHVTDLPREPAASWSHLLLAACRAATGSTDAYRWLLSAVTALPGVWQPLYLLGAAAEQRRDYTTADQAWTTLLQTHGIVTRFTLARSLAGTVARRDPAATAQTIIDVVEDFIARDPDLPESPQPILAAAECLRQRGDGAGAALLLHAASHRLPGVHLLQAAAQAVTDRPEIRRFRHRVGLLGWVHVPTLAPAAAVAVWFDLPPLVLAGLVPVLAAHLAAARARVPGFTASDSAAWRAGRRLGQGPAARMLNTEQRFTFGLLAAIVLTATVPIAGAFASAVTGRPAAIARTAEYAAVSGVTFAVMITVLTTLGRGILTVARRHNWRTAQRARRHAALHRLSDSGACRCWRTSALTGSYATAYLGRHLAPVTPDAWDDHRFPGAAVARCPSTGALWLATTGEPKDRLLLLRGVDQASSYDALPPPATGGYI